jgi:hypothetical protein
MPVDSLQTASSHGPTSTDSQSLGHIIDVDVVAVVAGPVVEVDVDIVVVDPPLFSPPTFEPPSPLPPSLSVLLFPAPHADARATRAGSAKREILEEGEARNMTLPYRGSLAGARSTPRGRAAKPTWNDAATVLF